MTVINKTWNERYSQSGKKAPGDVSADEVFIFGEHTTRVSSGVDRAPGSYPGFVKQTVSYMTKERVSRGKVIWPAEQKFRTVWKRLPRESYEVDHAYSATHTYASAYGAVCIYRLGQWNNYGTPHNWDLTVAIDPWSSNDDISLLGKLREVIAGSSFNAGVAVAELPQSLKMIATSATKIFNAYKAVKRGQPMTAAKILTGKLPPARTQRKLIPKREAAANNWLELQYGWKPLLSDVHDAALFIDQQMSRPVTQRFVATRFYGGNREGLVRNYNIGNAYVTIPTRWISSKRIIAKLTEVNVARLSGLMDPASVAWELVPFSFVADWFIPVGNYLSARGLESSLTGVYVTTKKFQVKTTGFKAKSNYTLSSWHDGRKCFFNRVIISRTVSTSLNIPVPEIKAIGKIASWEHAANAVALVIGLRK